MHDHKHTSGTKAKTKQNQMHAATAEMEIRQYAYRSGMLHIDSTELLLGMNTDTPDQIYTPLTCWVDTGCACPATSSR